MLNYICAALQVVFLIIAAVALCVFRNKHIFNGSFNIDSSHCFWNMDHSVRLPRYYIKHYYISKQQKKKINYEIAKTRYYSGNFFLYYDGKIHNTSAASILSPHLVLLSFLLNRILKDVHFIAISAAAAILISVSVNPDLVFFTPVLLLCTAFLGVPWRTNTLIRENWRSDCFSLNISGNSKLQKEFVKPSYLFFSISSLMHELSILLLTIQAVCSYYQGFGILQVANLLCTCILLAFSIYPYVKNIRGVYPKEGKDIFILFAEMAIFAVASILLNTYAPHVIHFAVAPVYLFPFNVALALLEPVSTHILQMYAPSNAAYRKLRYKYEYKNNKDLFCGFSFSNNDSSFSERFKEEYLPEEEARLIRKEREEKRLREEKEKEEQRIREAQEKERKEKIHQLVEQKNSATGSKKLYLEAQLWELRGYNDRAVASKREADKLRKEEEKQEEERKRFQKEYEYRKRATIPFSGRMITPEEYEREYTLLCRALGIGKFADPDKKPPVEVKKKEKEGGYSNDIDTNNATNRFKNRRR